MPDLQRVAQIIEHTGLVQERATLQQYITVLQEVRRDLMLQLK